MAAALIGSALILVASPATAAVAASAQPTTPHVQPGVAAAPLVATPWTDAPQRVVTPARAATAPVAASGAVAHLLPVTAHRDGADPEPRYQVERGDYLGAIADRYVGDFSDFPELARINKIKDPDRIFPGQLLRLPNEAQDHGYRPHASGLVIEPGVEDGYDPTQPPPTPPKETSPVPPAQPARPKPPIITVPPILPAPRPAEVAPLPPASPDQNMAAGAPVQSDTGLQINRPLAVSAVIAAAAIVGAQVGTVFGLRRRPAGTPLDGGRHRAEHD
jgi:LysM repeat protein